MRAIDVSVYSGEIPVEKWRAVKAEGYDLAIIGLFHGRTANRYAVQQMRAAHEAGMLLAGYVLIAGWLGLEGSQQIAVGMEQVPSDMRPKLKFLAVDVEVDGVSKNMIHGALVAVEEYGYRPIIYTGRWWWVYHFNDSQAFRDLPLWAAQYPLVHPDPPEVYLGNVALFGGWTQDKLVGWQYAGTSDVCGVSCDLNWFDDAFVGDLKEEPMPEPFTKEQEDRINYIIARHEKAEELEQAARGAVAHRAFGAVLSILTGHWKNLPGDLKSIKNEAEYWKRWEG